MTGRYTHGHHDSVLKSHRERTAENSAAYLLPHLTEDTKLLDIGAGPGTITADFAEIVGEVTATELGDAELSLTRATIAEREIANVTFAVEDAHALSFADDTFDVVHAHQVLQHVSDPIQCLREMRRVAKPGGLVAVRDSDYSGMVWYPEVPELDLWMQLYQAAARENGGEPNAGRRLKSWALAAGFSEVEATSATSCYSTAEKVQWWGGLWAERITESAIARQLVDSGRATQTDLQRIADGWRRWADADDAWISLLHGQVLATP